MKTVKFTINLKWIFGIALVLVFLAMCTSCAKKITFLTSSVVPAARGEVTFKKDKNNNYKINLELYYLAEPARLQPPKSTYVVWLISNNDEKPINIGQIVGTSSLKVKFETVSSSKPKKIFITAEDNPTIDYPSNFIVLETNNF